MISTSVIRAKLGAAELATNNNTSLNSVSLSASSSVYLFAAAYSREAKMAAPTVGSSLQGLKEQKSKLQSELREVITALSSMLR